jgi:hypothetical protein
MARQPTPNDLWRPGKLDRCGAQAIEAEDAFVAGVDSKERFRAAQLMAFAGVAAQEFIERLLAAIGRVPIMLLANGFFVPGTITDASSARLERLPATSHSGQADSPAGPASGDCPFRKAALDPPLRLRL